MLRKESINFTLMLSKSFVKFTLSLANILHTSTFLNTCWNINYLECQPKFVVFTVEKYLPLTLERMVDLQFK